MAARQSVSILQSGPISPSMLLRIATTPKVARQGAVNPKASVPERPKSDMLFLQSRLAVVSIYVRANRSTPIYRTDELC
jgi:hypothetical protein